MAKGRKKSSKTSVENIYPLIRRTILTQNLMQTTGSNSQPKLLAFYPTTEAANATNTSSLDFNETQDTATRSTGPDPEKDAEVSSPEGRHNSLLWG